MAKKKFLLFMLVFYILLLLRHLFLISNLFSLDTVEDQLIETFGVTHPRLVIHAGPHKTGTTFFQTEILIKLSNELKQDGYFVPTSVEFPGYFHGTSKVVANLAISLMTDVSCFQNTGEIQCINEYSKTLETGIKFVQSAWSNNKSVLLSSEDFDKPLNTTKFMHLLPPSREVEVILVYRCLLDWLRSFHNQLLKDRLPRIGSLVQWLRCTIIPNLPSYAMELQVSEVAKRFLNMNITKLSVKVLRYRKGANVASEIVCNVLKASQTCHKYMLNTSILSPEGNVRSDSSLILLVNAGKEMGILSSNFSLPNTFTLLHLERHYNLTKKVKDLSRDCLETNFFEMLKKNQLEEMEYMKKFLGSSEKLCEKCGHEICVPNVSELLLDNGWLQMLKGIDTHGFVD